ncbi:hypothetical protein C0995_013486 [Termitomyces sp. Mi166|nr:hypothetical protein C0995_013486 [Termitomyces sp. Mi166\
MSDAEAELVVFGEVYAPFIIGMMIGCFLFGITASQAVIYLRRYRQDKLLVRVVVWGSLILDTFHFAMVAEVVYFWYIICRRPEKYLGLLDFHWSLGASIIATSSLSSLQLVFGFVLWGDLTVQRLLSAVHEQMGQVGGSIELAATSLCDIAISISLWFYLHRNRSGFASTETVVKKLILYTINIVTLNYRKTARAILNQAGQTQGTTSRFFQDLDNDIQLQHFSKGIDESHAKSTVEP